MGRVLSDSAAFNYPHHMKLKEVNVGILAIDLGTQVGIAQGTFNIHTDVVWNRDKMVKKASVGHFELPVNTYLTTLKEHIRERMYVLAPDTKHDELVIIVPQPTFAFKVMRRHWKMIGVIEQLAEEHGNTTVLEVLDNHVRKVVVGPTQKNNFKSAYERRMLRKQMVMMRYGTYAETDDEADALMFLEWYLTSRA